MFLFGFKKKEFCAERNGDRKALPKKTHEIAIRRVDYRTRKNVEATFKMSTSIEYILYDGSKLFFSRGKCGGAPLASSENDHARYITHSVEGMEDVRVCVLGERQVMLNLFLCENKSYFATLTNTDDYDEYNWGADHEKITVWKYEAGVFRMMQTMPKRHVRSFCLSPDGEVVAVARGATNATIEFLSTTSGETIDSWTCFRGEGYETVPDESNIFNSISLAKINDEYVVAHLRNTVTPQSSGISDSAIKYYYLEENSGVEIRLLDGRTIATIDHPNTVKVEFYNNGTMLRHFEGLFGMPMRSFQKAVTYSVEGDKVTTVSSATPPPEHGKS